MDSAGKRIKIRAKKKKKIRSKISGTPESPRVSVYRSLKHIYAQAIDDEGGKTLTSCSTLDQDLQKKLEGKSGNKEAAKLVGESLAKKLSEQGIKQIVFDRNGFLFHGRVKSLADGAREGGLQF